MNMLTEFLKKHIVINCIIFLIILVVCLTGIILTLIFDDNKNINTDKVSTVEYSIPSNINEVYEGLLNVDEYKDDLLFELKEDSIEVTRVEDNFKCIIEYSNTYDCSVVKLNKEDKEPFKICYNIEYTDYNEYIVDIKDSIMDKEMSEENRVNLTVNEDGSFNIDIK